MPTTTSPAQRTARSGLMLHCGGAEVEWSAVQSLPEPQPLSEAHYPIPHSTFVDTVVAGLTSHGFSITDQCHALWGDNGLRYFGIICLAGNNLPVAEEGGSEWQFVLGLRNSHDFSFSASALGGTIMPWICDNLMWAGGEIVKIARRHTRFIMRDLEGLVHERLGEVAQVAINIDARFDSYKKFNFDSITPLLEQDPFDNPDFADDIQAENAQMRDNCRLANGARFILDAASARAVPPTRTSKVWDEFKREDGPGGHIQLAGGTGWTMMNAFTEVEKASPSLLEGPRRNSRLTSLLDGACGLTTTLVSVEE